MSGRRPTWKHGLPYGTIQTFIGMLITGLCLVGIGVLMLVLFYAVYLR